MILGEFNKIIIEVWIFGWICKKEYGGVCIFEVGIDCLYVYEKYVYVLVWVKMFCLFKEYI